MNHPRGPQLHRRTFMAGVGAAATLPAIDLAGAAPTAQAAGAQLSADGVSIEANWAGQIVIRDGNSTQRETLQGVYLTGDATSYNGDATMGEYHGAPAIVVTYTGLPAPFQATGWFTVSANRVSAHYRIIAPQDWWGEGFMIFRNFETPTWERHPTSLWEWARDPRGGVPFQRPAVDAYRVDFPDGQVLNELVQRNTAAWVNSSAFHVPATRTATGAWETNYDVVLGDIPRPALAGVLTGHTLAAHATTDQKFHWYHADQASATITLGAYNTSNERDATITWTLHDFYGNVPTQGHWTGRMTPGPWSKTITTPPLTQGIYFLEVNVQSGDQSALCRLNITVLPDKQLDSPTTSPFGLAAVFSDWGADYGLTPKDWATLIKRIGVKHLRMPQLPAELRSYAGVDTQHHTWLSGTDFRDGQTYPNGTLNVDAQQKQFADILAECQQIGARVEEYGNELNLKGGFLKGAFVDAYMHDYLKPLRTYFDQHEATTGITLQGIGGPDYVFLQKCVEQGAWGMVDAVVLHPGRGNYTPDYAPAPATWDSNTYWNFLGGVRKIRQDMRTYTARYGGHKEFLLTEVYAPTKPNSWWEDTYRTSAENTLLTAALAMSEKVDRFYWYQMNDSIFSSPGTANDQDREWHFGMTMIDTSFKPMLLAYANAAEHLGDATFKRWLTFDDADTKGLLFDTPRGELQIIWSRADGYVLNQDHTADAFYKEPEPWVDPWPTKKTITLQPQAGVKTIRAIDCIGTQTPVPAAGGRVTLTIDGAPKLYYGLRSC